MSLEEKTCIIKGSVRCRQFNDLSSSQKMPTRLTKFSFQKHLFSENGWV